MDLDPLCLKSLGSISWFAAPNHVRDIVSLQFRQVEGQR